MPRLINRNPSYRKHRASGQAIVTLNGEDVYLGAHGSKASKEKYDQVIGEWLSRGRQRPGDDPDRRVADVIAGYWEHAKVYYGGGENGRAEVDSIKRALAILRRAYGDTPANDFGPLALQVVRDRMVEEGWSRPYVNAQVSRVKRCFQWACSRELVKPELAHGLETVKGLRKGKTDAPETEPVKPVPDAYVVETCKHLSRVVKGMVELQLASGMRPGELCTMRVGDVDTTGNVWEYTPGRHKTDYRGHKRPIYLGPRAQAIVKDFLKPDTQAYLFSPIDAEAERRRDLAKARTTSLSCGNVPGSNRAKKPRRAPTSRYTVAAYRKAIARACDEAFPPPAELRRVRVKGGKKDNTRWETVREWRARLGAEGAAVLAKWLSDHRWHPHQLRHNTATKLRKDHGIDAARVVLGHRSNAVTEVYAEIDYGKARDIMGRVG